MKTKAMKKNYSSRKGYIKITRSLLEDYQMSKLVFSNFFPARIEPDFNDVLIIYCRSLYFDVISDGEVPPEYMVTVEGLNSKLKIKNVTRV